MECHVVIVGDAKVGKSSLLHRLTQNEFLEVTDFISNNKRLTSSSLWGLFEKNLIFIYKSLTPTKAVHEGLKNPKKNLSWQKIIIIYHYYQVDTRHNETLEFWGWPARQWVCCRWWPVCPWQTLGRSFWNPSFGTRLTAAYSV